MNRTEQFLASFNELEQFLRESTDSTRSTSFGGTIGRASHDNAAVRHYQRDLREWADLRNAIVHEHPKGQVIAEVTPEALNDFQKLVAKVTGPQRVFPQFQRTVRVFDDEDGLQDAIQDLWDQGYSQVIVRREKLMGLLSYNGITRWMSSEINGTVIDLAGATVGDAMPFEEEGGIAFLDRNATVFDARELFQVFPEKHKQRLRVIVITEHGKATEGPLGLISASDLIEADF